jgi:ribosomal protein L1
MGKKRIKVFGDEEPKKQKKGPDDGRKLVKTGKQHGRITDMGQVALDEADEIKEKEAKETKKIKKEAKDEAKKVTKKKVKKKKKGKKYLQAKKKVDVLKKYPLKDAIKLVKKTSISSFKGAIEMHLAIKEKGLKRELELPHPVGKEKKLSIATEKKFPLIHLVIGSLDTKDDHLAKNFLAIIELVGPKKIKKVVLACTMGPGVKVDLENLEN